MANRPNILFLFSDQHSAHTMSCAGHPVVQTPHMDRLAREGIHFTNTYCSTPLCMPQRFSLVPGRFSHNTGVLYNNGKLHEGEPTFVQALKNAGYHTCVTGKIHFCQREKPGTEACDEHLHEMGFDDVMSHGGKGFTILAEETDSYKAYLQKKGVADAFYEDYKARQFGDRPHWFAAPSALSEEDFHDAYIGQITADWIGDYDGDKPFFCWCNWGGPHSPWDAPGRYAEMYDPAEVDSPLEDPLENAPEDLIERQQKTMGGMPEEAWRDCRSHYYGMINVVDDGIGKMLDALQQTGKLENTIVVYASDHGEMLYDRGMHGKTLMYDQSAKVPLVIRLPEGFERGRTSETLVSSLDLIATFLDLADESIKICHGESLMPTLNGETESHRDEVFSEMGPKKMIRRGEWKYVYSPERGIQQLFNLVDDPNELNNLSGSAGVLALEREMRERLLEWIIETEEQPTGRR